MRRLHDDVERKVQARVLRDTACYETLRTTSLGEEATNQVLSYFPARDVEEPVTKEFLRSELALSRLELREELETFRTEFRTELRGEMDRLRTDLRTEMGTLNTELRGEMGTVKDEMAEMRHGIAALGTKIDGVSTQSTIATAELRTEIHAELRNQLITIIMAMIAMVGAMAAVQHWM